MKYTEIKLDSPGILCFDVPKLTFDSLQKQIDNLENSEGKPANSKLAGQLEKEFILNCPANVKFFLLEASLAYSKFYSIGSQDFVVKNIWVNLQQKHEYNPFHKHSDATLSFIIFMNIPYELTDEDKLNNTKNSNAKQNSRLAFTYNSFFHGMMTKTLDVDKSFLGKMILFPSSAYHGVYPFYTSDQYRITVSGNIV